MQATSSHGAFPKSPAHTLSISLYGIQGLKFHHSSRRQLAPMGTMWEMNRCSELSSNQNRTNHKSILTLPRAADGAVAEWGWCRSPAEDVSRWILQMQSR